MGRATPASSCHHKPLDIEFAQQGILQRMAFRRGVHPFNVLMIVFGGRNGRAVATSGYAKATAWRRRGGSNRTDGCARNLAATVSSQLNSQAHREKSRSQIAIVGSDHEWSRLRPANGRRTPPAQCSQGGDQRRMRGYHTRASPSECRQSVL